MNKRRVSASVPVVLLVVAAVGGCGKGGIIGDRYEPPERLCSSEGMATTGTAIIRVSIVGEGPVVTPAKCCVAQGATVVWVPDTTVKSASLRFAADCGSATLGDTPDKYGKKEFTFLETNGTADPTGLTVGLTSKSAFPYCLSANGGPEPYPAIIIKPTSGTRCPE